MINIKIRLFQIIEKAEEEDEMSRIFDIFILTLICFNILAIILESHQNLLFKYEEYFKMFEKFSVIVFTTEYILRLWTATVSYKGLSSFKAGLKQAKTPLAIIDLLAILPFYLPMFLPFDLRILRVMRIARFLRILKLNRYSKALLVIGKIFNKKKDILLATIYIMFMTILMSSVFMYYVENSAQPEHFSSITATFWWAVATLTTVGYGDVYPVTAIGKILATIIAITGIGIVALPTGILSSGFIEEMNESKECDHIVCPYCKEKIDVK